jgi:hypothetical protein
MDSHTQPSIQPPVEDSLLLEPIVIVDLDELKTVGVTPEEIRKTGQLILVYRKGFKDFGNKRGWACTCMSDTKDGVREVMIMVDEILSGSLADYNLFPSYDPKRPEEIYWNWSEHPKFTIDDKYAPDEASQIRVLISRLSDANAFGIYDTTLPKTPTSWTGGIWNWYRNPLQPPLVTSHMTTNPKELRDRINYLITRVSRLDGTQAAYWKDVLWMLNYSIEILPMMNDTGVKHICTLINQLVIQWQKKKNTSSWGSILSSFGYPVLMTGTPEFRFETFRKSPSNEWLSNKKLKQEFKKSKPEAPTKRLPKRMSPIGIPKPAGTYGVFTENRFSSLEDPKTTELPSYSDTDWDYEDDETTVLKRPLSPTDTMLPPDQTEVEVKRREASSKRVGFCEECNPNVIASGKNAGFCSLPGKHEMRLSYESFKSPRCALCNDIVGTPCSLCHCPKCKDFVIFCTCKYDNKPLPRRPRTWVDVAAKGTPTITVEPPQKEGKARKRTPKGKQPSSMPEPEKSDQQKSNSSRSMGEHVEEEIIFDSTAPLSSHSSDEDSDHEGYTWSETAKKWLKNAKSKFTRKAPMPKPEVQHSFWKKIKRGLVVTHNYLYLGGKDDFETTSKTTSMTQGEAFVALVVSPVVVVYNSLAYTYSQYRKNVRWGIRKPWYKRWAAHALNVLALPLRVVYTTVTFLGVCVWGLIPKWAKSKWWVSKGP